MYRISNIKIPIIENDGDLFSYNSLVFLAAKRLGLKNSDIISVKLLRKSLDARKKSNIHYVVTLQVEAAEKYEKKIKFDKDIVFITETDITLPFNNPIKPKKSSEPPPVIVGLGPAGLFAGLVLARLGKSPIILERGEDVDSRRLSVEAFWKERKLNPECNVQFGEGGAGAFSDGKLTTGIKSPYMSFIFNEFVKHGAPPDILYEAKPHIGTDKLAPTVKSIRQEITGLGGKVIFNARFTDFGIVKGTPRPKISSAVYEQNGRAHEIPASRIILAAGHSARDVFELLKKKNISLSQKPFSVGVRIEHLQSDLNVSLYGDVYGKALKKYGLPSADYKLAVHLPNGRSVYSFCMCPGGYVVASSSEEGGLVTNGMSYYARDNINANSALLVGINTSDFPSDDVLAGVALQREIERKAFISGGGCYTAPIFMVGDFLERRISESLGKVKPTFLPGYKYAPPDEYLPDFVVRSLREAFPVFESRIKGFAAPHAIITGAETRSSSPVRINRGEDCGSIDVEGLYPCGEGAGYAGGIVSAAADGIKAALAGFDDNILI